MHVNRCVFLQKKGGQGGRERWLWFGLVFFVQPHIQQMEILVYQLHYCIDGPLLQEEMILVVTQQKAKIEMLDVRLQHFPFS